MNASRASFILLSKSSPPSSSSLQDGNRPVETPSALELRDGETGLALLTSVELKGVLRWGMAVHQAYI